MSISKQEAETITHMLLAARSALDGAITACASVQQILDGKLAEASSAAEPSEDATECEHPSDQCCATTGLSGPATMHCLKCDTPGLPLIGTLPDRKAG